MGGTEGALLFWLFRNRPSGLLSFVALDRLLAAGRAPLQFQLHMLKQLRHRRMDLAEEKMLESFEKYDSETGKGLLPLREFKLALEENQLGILEEHMKELSSIKILVRIEEVNYVRYKEYVEQALAPLAISGLLLNQAAKVVTYYFRKYHRLLRTGPK